MLHFLSRADVVGIIWISIRSTHLYFERAYRFQMHRELIAYASVYGDRIYIYIVFAFCPSLAEQLERVHAPIGLDIGSVTVEEIAVSISAELISMRRAERRKLVEGPFPVADTASDTI